MKILHKLSILCILFVSLPAWAQNPAGIVVTGLSKKAFTSSVRRQMAVQTFKQGILVRPPFRPQPVDLVSLRPFVAGVGEVTPRISSVQLESPVSLTPRSEIVSETVTPQTSRYESPLLPFLKEEWELPPIPPRVPPAYEERMPHTYVGWSLESLRRECSSLGILPQDWETYTRQELAYLLSTYKSLAGSAHAPSRFQPAAADNGKSQLEKELDVKAWAQQQPDFIKSNYISFGEKYDVPFTGERTPVHILVVNDVWEEVRDLTVAAWQEGNVSVDYADSIDEAMHKLELQTKAYDMVLVDHDMGDGTRGPSLSMWAYEKQLSVPMILYTRESMAAEWAYKFNLKGRLDISEDPVCVLNYVRNFLANGGHADPNAL